MPWSGSRRSRRRCRRRHARMFGARASRLRHWQPELGTCWRRRGGAPC